MVYMVGIDVMLMKCEICCEVLEFVFECVFSDLGKVYVFVWMVDGGMLLLFMGMVMD